jgi:hypothetical protein
MGCSPRVAVLDVWASPEVLLAAKTVGIPYLCPLDKPEPYDCVLSILTKKKHALAFCYSALRAWMSLQPGGTMVLVMREEAFVATRRFWPTPPILVKVVGDETRLAYAWRKPIALKAGTRRTAKKTVAR